MVINNEIIELIDIRYLLKVEESISFNNCIIKNIDLIGAFEIEIKLIFENCIIDDLQINSCWFINGFILKNNVINNIIDYQMGGHNSKPILIEGNVFLELFSFFDCQFEELIEIKNNIFKKGTNILGNKGEGFENSFDNGYLIENNIGQLDVDEV